MFPLAGSSLPTSPETLVEALRAGLAAQSIRAADVSARGEWPQLDALALDLTGTALDALPPFSRPSADSSGRFSVKEFTLRAVPAHFRGAPLEFEISARDAAFALAPADAPITASLTEVAAGSVSVQIALAALEQLVHRLAADAAREHGVDIKQTRLSLSARGPRAISLVAEVTAKAFIATATVTISGDAEIDEQLVARLSNLRFGGEGMIANLAGGVIRPVLAQLEGKTLPLMNFTGADLPLRDVQVTVGDTLRIAAQFGSRNELAE